MPRRKPARTSRRSGAARLRRGAAGVAAAGTRRRAASRCCSATPPPTGVIAYESEALEGMIVNETLLVEIVRPGTGDPVRRRRRRRGRRHLVQSGLSDDPPRYRRPLGGDGGARRRAGAPTCASRAGWAAPTRPPRSKACSCIPARFAEVGRRHPELGRLRLVVARDGEQDVMTLMAECAAPAAGSPRRSPPRCKR